MEREQEQAVQIGMVEREQEQVVQIGIVEQMQTGQREAEVFQIGSKTDVEGDVEGDTEMWEIFSSKRIIEHHLKFAEECIENNIYPLGLKTFVPCIKQITPSEKTGRPYLLHNTSLELLALCRTHFTKLLNKNNEKWEEIEKRAESYKEEGDRTKWEEAKIKMEDKEMKEVRNKKMKHAIRIHREGRVFVESCLTERESEGRESNEGRRGRCREEEKEKNPESMVPSQNCNRREMGEERVIEKWVKRG